MRIVVFRTASANFLADCEGDFSGKAYGCQVFGPGLSSRLEEEKREPTALGLRRNPAFSRERTSPWTALTSRFSALPRVSWRAAPIAVRMSKSSGSLKQTHGKPTPERGREEGRGRRHDRLRSCTPSPLQHGSFTPLSACTEERRRDGE